jgi:N-acetylmuramoyl-L-alanine amidase
LKQIVPFLILLAICFTQPSLKAQVADLSGYKIFINPGHGGFDSNDRFIEATGFWESEGNLVKGLFLRTLLQNLNATVYMSRTTNTTADDLPLSAISELANAANADFFLSIHSNGFDGKANRPLMLFRGYDNQPVYPESKVMAEIMWQKIFENGNCWTSNTPYVKGDWTFYPDWGLQGLGVLRNLTMAGVLSEGSFHDYIPESWRLRNTDFLHHESWALARSFIGYRNVVPPGHGVIAGIIRDPLRSPSWYFKAGTKDAAIPLNGAKVMLSPGNKLYNVDNLNNGFFMFDSLAPGSYSLYVTGVPGFMNDTLDVTVSANKSTLAESFLSFDTTMVPGLTSVTPSFADSLLLNQEITFVFDIAMDRDSVQKYLLFEPAVGLVYSWNEAQTVLKVNPLIQFTQKTNYSITLLPAACSKWKVPTAIQYSFNFTTISRTRLKLESSFPTDGLTETTLFPQVTLVFDAPLNPVLLAANVMVEDDQGNLLARTNEEVTSSMGKGYYRFELSEPLANGRQYRVRLRPALADMAGITLGTDLDIHFTSRTRPYPTGTLIESYDDISRFWDPEASGSTIGTDNPLTTFTSSATIKKSGTAAGKLSYQFINPSGGVCRVFNTQKPIIGSDTASHFGVWVYGDLSFNSLEYWFYSSGSINQIVPVCNIDWAGWDFKSIPLYSIGGSGDRNFHSVVIRQSTEGAMMGVNFFDDAIIFSPTEGTPEHDATEGTVVAFPNPLRGEGNIGFVLANKSEIRLQLFNTTGALMSTIAVGEFEAGKHSLSWNPPPTARAGIYILRMEVKEPGGRLIRIASGKCIILK